MKALISRRAGGPETLVFEEVPDPTPKAGEILIRVQAVGVNFPDGLLIRDLYQIKPPRPFSPGSELCGVVETLGSGVAGFEVGDRVIARCGWGGMAEKIAVTTGRCVRIPAGVPREEAAAFIFTYATAYHALHDAGSLQHGETLLVLGAAGGVGSAALDLGRASGARVLAAVSSQEKLSFALEHGATYGMIYANRVEGKDAEKALASQFKELAGAQGANVIVDPVGGAYSEAALRAIARYGRHLVVGFVAGIPKLPLNLALLKSCRIVGVDWRSFVQYESEANNRNLEALIALWQSGKIRPSVSECYPLKRGGEAIARLYDRQAVGKVVVLID